MLAFNQSGCIDHPPLLFLHGILGAKEDWEQVISLLENAFHCIAIDLPGHGISPFSLPLEETVAEVLDHLQIQKCGLIGYSLGGRLALNLKRANTKRFPRPVLISTNPGIAVHEKKQRKQTDQDWAEKLDTLSIKDFLALWYAQPVFRSLHQRPDLLIQIIERRSQVRKEEVSYFLSHFSVADQQIYYPDDALFLCGKEDLKYADLYRTLPLPVESAEIEGAGHVLHLENPEACAFKIRSWFIT